MPDFSGPCISIRSHHGFLWQVEPGKNSVVADCKTADEPCCFQIFGAEAPQRSLTKKGIEERLAPPVTAAAAAAAEAEETSSASNVARMVRPCTMPFELETKS